MCPTKNMVRLDEAETRTKILVSNTIKRKLVRVRVPLPAP